MVSLKQKNVLAVFVYSLICKVLVCYTLIYVDKTGYIAFPLSYILLTWMCLEKYTSEKYSQTQIILTILVGTLLLTIPARITDFFGTIGSLLTEITGIAGIFAGWLLTNKRKIWLLLLILLAFFLLAGLLDDKSTFLFEKYCHS